jgi:hypothetical protein
MSFNHSFQFIDRDVVDPMLQLTWTEYQKKYRVKRGDLVEIIDILACDQTPQEIDRIIKTKTVLWFVKKGGMICLDYAIGGARSVRKRCPSIQLNRIPLEEVAVIYSAAVDGFLKKKIDGKTMYTAFAICNAGGGEDFLGVPRKIRTVIDEILEHLSNTEKPMFPWQKSSFDPWSECGFRFMGSKDTKRFVDFVIQAWKENWPVPFQMYQVGAKDDCFREYYVPQMLMKCIESMPYRNQCLMYCWG